MVAIWRPLTILSFPFWVSAYFQQKNRYFQRGYYKNIYEHIYDHNWSSTGDDNYTLQVDNNLWILMLTSLGMCQRKDVDQPCFWMHFQVFQKICWTPKVENTLQETNISHHGKKKIIFKGVLGWDMLVPSRVPLTIESHIFIDRLCFPCHIHLPICLNLIDPEGKFGWVSSNPSHVSSLQNYSWWYSAYPSHRLKQSWKSKKITFLNNGTLDIHLHS